MKDEINAWKSRAEAAEEDLRWFESQNKQLRRKTNTLIKLA
jgi:hypothetical protein